MSRGPDFVNDAWRLWPYVKSMVKVSIFYPSRHDSHFDVDYYLNTHMPLAAFHM